MSKLVAISDGHEMTTAGKRTPAISELDGRVIKENEFNKPVAIMLAEELERCGFRTLNVSTTDNDTLADRVKRANDANADIFVAIHYNAFDGKFDDYDPSGLSVHIYPGSVEGKKLAENVIKHLSKGSKQKNRGIKDNNFYVLRNTQMPAILTENGFMDNKDEALLMLNEDFQKEVAIEHAKGICDYFEIEYKEVNEVVKTAIMGESECNAVQLKAYLLMNNKDPQINISLDTFCQSWIEEGKVEGVKGDIAFCQACHETGYFKYGGQVLPRQNNFGGIGAVNDSPVGYGAWFDTAYQGIRANIQHLKGYATTQILVNDIVDPRYRILKKYNLLGSAPNFEDLSGKWAYPGYDTTRYDNLVEANENKDTYGYSILKKFQIMKEINIRVDDENSEVESLREENNKLKGIIKKIMKLLIN